MTKVERMQLTRELINQGGVVIYFEADEFSPNLIWCFGYMMVGDRLTQVRYCASLSQVYISPGRSVREEIRKVVVNELFKYL
jgi:hypothetical protein